MGFIHTQILPKAVNGWGSVPDPQIEKETSAFGACQSDKSGWKWC